MSMKFRPLAFCVLAAFAVATFGPLAPAEAASSPTLSYSRQSLSGNMARACENAIALIEEECDFHGPITTTPNGCHTHPAPLGQICKCTATASYCGILNPNPPTFP